jgi:transposase-like protein
MKEPESLQQAIVYFADMDNCIAYLSVRRWPDGRLVCPNCGCESVSAFNPKRKTWKCAVHHPKREFSVKVGTLFEESPIGLDKWLTATWTLTNCKNGISSYEIARALKVSQKTAWFMLHRIRMALQDENFGGKLGGPGNEVESDETFVGPNPQKMHKDRRARCQAMRGQEMRGDRYVGKTAVFGVLDRNLRQVRAKVIPNVKRETLQNEILNNVHPGSQVYTDAAASYDRFSDQFVHEVVNHAMEYVRGQVHTQGIDNFWSLLKRTLRGTYVAVEPFHLDRYLDEQVFRFNNRATKDNRLTDADRFDLAVRNIVRKRLTFAELTGKPN